MDSELESSLMGCDRRVELFLLSWSYDLETSQVDYFQRVFRSTISKPKKNDPNSNSFQLEKMILQNQLYQTMHKKNKLLLLEQILAMGSSELEF
ncbi:unnamed protein product [Auanema sp. JU1783]|nr:unnamed protein product [Auanema sp. JU1783]